MFDSLFLIIIILIYIKYYQFIKNYNVLQFRKKKKTKYVLTTFIRIHMVSAIVYR